MCEFEFGVYSLGERIPDANGFILKIKKEIRISKGERNMGILTYILQGILALMFLMAGFGKVTGSKMHVEAFTHWRLPQWFRVVTGIVELAGAVLLIVGFWTSTSAMAGALLLAITCVGGILTHIRVKDSFKDTAMILFLAILSFVVFFLYFS